VIQTWSQAHISPTKVAVILTMEVVFAALFAMVFTDETLNLQQMLGGVLILISMLAIVIKEDPGASNAENGTADNEKKAN
jgi:drug/metabolite transporter (DMT)-like permease